ncbi:MAG: DNA polymerase III subunit chi [Alphaproteobacteria bacterium]|nr:DNA polymerase III subunit chi [Alphaproteobacteria bacterium]MCB9928037.1 DNA polymerase III subunit chi [Alphaproteobacteria bacterium]
MEVHFRNLASKPLERWLPTLAADLYGQGLRLVVRVGSEPRLRSLDQALWTYDPGSFLPHGAAGDGQDEQQPILITMGSAAPNGASIVLAVDDCSATPDEGFQRLDYFFDRNDAAGRDAARIRWREWRELGIEPIYWEADAQGWRRAG